MIYMMFKSGHWTEKSEKQRWTLCNPFLVHQDVSVICVCLHGGDSLQTYGLGGEMKGLS